MVLMVTGQTLDRSVIEREREVLRIGGSNIDRMVVSGGGDSQAFRRTEAPSGDEFRCSST
jgi:hypothetical protein